MRECVLSLADTADTYPSLLILQGIAEESDGATCIFVEGIKVCWKGKHGLFSLHNYVILMITTDMWSEFLYLLDILD